MRVRHANRPNRRMRATVVALGAACLVGAACTDDGGGGAVIGSARSATTPPATVAPPGAPAPGGTGSAWDRIPEIVREVQPSVVAIATATGEGSGVVYDAEGHIVTNAHVVGSSTSVQVHYADGQTATAEVVAADRTVDLALLRSPRTDVPPAAFATEIPQVGELALAIGNPLGFENTVTAGIISGTDRSIPGGGPALVGLLQTDAPISPGNSGGALVGANGQVVGINVAYIPPQGGAVALGFAIPSPFVREAVRSVLRDGRLNLAFLGITPSTVTPQIAERFRLGVDAGVLVLEVSPGSPADAAGLQPGDVIVQIGGEQVRTTEELFSQLRRHRPGEQVVLTLSRDGERREARVTLGQRP